MNGGATCPYCGRSRDGNIGPVTREIVGEIVTWCSWCMVVWDKGKLMKTGRIVVKDRDLWTDVPEGVLVVRERETE